MLNINTNDVGFDDACLGFPAVETCQAIVYQTNLGLFGWHDGLGTESAFAKKAEAFNLFIQNNAQNNVNGVCLIGTIRGYSRWSANQQTQWQAELRTVANNIGFNGTIWGVRLTTHLNLSKNENAFIRYDIAQPHCTVKFKRWSKMGHVDLPNDPNLQHLAKGSVNPLDMQNATSEQEKYALVNNVPYNLVQPTYNWAVRRKGKKDTLLDNEGNLNVVPDKDFINLT